MRLNSCIGVAVAFLAVSCSRQLPLERKAAQLEPGMDREAVARLFSAFGQGWHSKDEHRSLQELKGIHVFNTNSPLGSYVVYHDRGGYFSIWEECTVWFGTNRTVVVAYRYLVIN
jgi:hypothetical protein